MSKSIGGRQVETKWWRLGLVIGAANLAFLLVLVSLLTVDVTLALGFAVVGSIVGGVAVLLYVKHVS